MSQPAFVSIAGELLNSAMLQRVEVRQRLNDHWFCEIECRDTLGSPIPGESALGAPCQLSNVGEDDSPHTIFSGVVIDVALRQEVWGSYTAVLRAASTSWLIDQSERNAYFPSPSLNVVAQQLTGTAGGFSAQLAEKTSPAEYLQYGETNWSFLLRLADDHGGWIRAGLGIPELRNTFDDARPLLFRGELGLLEFFVDGELAPATIGAAQYDANTFVSQITPGAQKSPRFESAGQRMGDAVATGSAAMQLAGFTSRSRSATCAEMVDRARSEAERAMGGAVLAGGTSRDQTVTAGSAIDVQNLGEASGVYNVLEATHLWNPAGYLNHFVATPWKNWHAARRPAPAIGLGAQVARVVGNHDPQQQGRLRVALYWQSNGPIDWAPMASLHSGANFGLTAMPEIGDEVLVSFLDGDPERPVILGSLWNSTHPPPREQFATANESDANLVKRLVTKSGIRIHIVDTPGQESISLATPRSNNLLLSEKVTETSRPIIAMHTEGDIHLRAEGRIHRISTTQSNDIGISGPSLAGMSCTQKMRKAMEHAPWGAGVMHALGGAKGVAAFVAGAIALQFVPIAGEVEDALILVGTLMAGGNILKGLQQLKQFKDFCCGQAKTEADLKQAGKMVADALATIGVNGVLAALPFIKEAKGTAATEEEGAIRGTGKDGISELTLTGPAAEAKSWQGKGDYPGVDEWTNTPLNKGDLVIGATPGQGNFYSSAKEFGNSDITAQEYYNKLQIAPNTSDPAYAPYRNGLTVYKVNDNIVAGTSQALANPQLGSGGSTQYFLSNPSTQLTPIRTVPFAH